MAMTVRVVTDEEQLAVAKSAIGDDVERLRVEADRLRRARHPGVVELLESHPVDGGWELRTAHAGPALAALGPLPVDRLATVAAAVAATLADLHGAGITHGRLDASHMLVGPRGGPRLCGFGPGPDPRPDSCDPNDDIAALGAVIIERLGPEANGEVLSFRRRRSRGATGWERRTLLTLADHACAEPASRRPTARRLAASLADAFPTDRAPRHLSPPQRLRPWGIAAAAGVAALALVAAAAVDRTDAAGERGAPDVPPTALADPGPPAPGPGCPATAGACRAEVVVDGSILTVRGQRFEVGEPGDQIVVGDWDCDGEATPALLRPATGEVFVFPAWAEGTDLVVGPVLTVSGATALIADDRVDGCTDLAARRSDGGLVPVLGSIAG